MSHVRTSFLDAVRHARAVLDRPEVAARWSDATADGPTVEALATRIVDVALAVPARLDEPEPTDEVDLGAEDQLLARGADVAPTPAPGFGGDDGHAALVARIDHLVVELLERLPAEASERRVALAGGGTATLDDYLLAQMVVLLVLTDRLVQVDPSTVPEPPAGATARTIACLAELAVRRRGDTAVLRALAGEHWADVASLPG